MTTARWTDMEPGMMKMGPSPIGQPGFQMYADQGDKVVGVMIALIVLSTTFVTLRLLSRRVARAGFWWDDVLIIVALLISMAAPILNIHAVKTAGFGKHIYRLGKVAQDDARDTFKFLWIFQLFFCLSTGIIKLCTLVFYRRIFPIVQLRKVIVVIAGIVASFTISVLLITIFQCEPIHKFWDFEQPGRCLNPYLNLLVTGSFNTTLDFIVVFLPVPLLWQLRTSIKQKCVLTAIFVSAGFVCVVSILRLLAFSEANPDDITWNSTQVAIWSAVEPCAGIISACIPSLRPLLTLFLRSCRTRLPYFHHPVTSRSDSQCAAAVWIEQQRSLANEPRELRGARSSTERLPGPICRVISPDPDVEKAGTDKEKVSVSEREVPNGVIQVETEIRWSISPRMEYDYRVF